MNNVSKWALSDSLACLSQTHCQVFFFLFLGFIKHQVIATVVIRLQVDTELKKNCQKVHPAAWIGLNLVPPLGRVGTRSAGEETKLISRLCLSQ